MRFLSKISLILLMLVVLTSFVVAMKNPSTIYCEEMGYEYRVVGEEGKCVLPTGEVSSWKFFRGEEGKEHSYCEKQGYELRVVRSDVCRYDTECSICILSDGTEKTVSELMNLDVSETTCGDGSCGIPENHYTCSQDCPSGSIDAYCDAIEDGICDIDCAEGKDKDCQGISLLYVAIGIVLILILAMVGWNWFSKRKSS